MPTIKCKDGAQASRLFDLLMKIHEGRKFTVNRNSAFAHINELELDVEEVA